MEHFKIIGSFFALILGVFVLVTLFQEQKRHPSGYLKAIFFQTLTTNFLILLLFYAKYLDVNIQPDTKISSNPALFAFLMSATSIILIAMNHFLVTASYKISKRPVPPFHRRMAIPIYIGIIFICVILIITGANEITIVDLYILLFTFLFIVYTYEFLILFILLIKSFKSYFTDRRQALISFSALYLSRYYLLPSIFILNFFPNIKEFLLVINGRFFLIYINLIPFIWLKKSYIKITRKSDEKESINAAVERVLQKYNISKREEEILRLILEGKTNGEITEILFISTHTVKNHIYSIFQKLGINSRYQLIKFISNKEFVS
jgi:DNA-binding CsgD family transcriptional regulator